VKKKKKKKREREKERGKRTALLVYVNKCM
jgi:hypothetical protein